MTQTGHQDELGDVTVFGYAPVEAEGHIGDCPFYFRARGESWKLTVSPPGTDAAEAMVDGNGLWSVDGRWGVGMFSASWMPHEKAYELIRTALGQFHVLRQQ